MFSFVIPYLKLLVLVFSVLFPVHEAPAQQPFCSTKDITTTPLLLQKFNEELTAHYDRLVAQKAISEVEKIEELKKHENPEIKVCPNPQNTAQKTVYIEYEKNWWGSLYFVVVKDHDILKWTEIETYGATTKYVQWNEKGFFYEDSTHMGTKTQNICSIQENSVECKEIRRFNE